MSGHVAPLVVLTRPKGKNAALSAFLRTEGARVIELPALQLQAVSVVPEKLPRPNRFDLLVFVSTTALSAYEDALYQYAEPDSAVLTPVKPRFVAAVGEATAAAVQQSRFFSQFRVLAPEPGARADSEGLWPQIYPYLSAIETALVVRGQVGREWLGHQLEASGVSVLRYASYQRTVAVWQEAQVKALQSGVSSAPSAPRVWLMTSSEGVDAIFGQLEHHQLLDAVLDARFVVVHDRIAQHLISCYATRFPDKPKPAVTLCEPETNAMCQALAAVAAL